MGSVEEEKRGEEMISVFISLRKFLLYFGLITLPFIIRLDLAPLIPGPIDNVRYAKEILSFIIVAAFVILSFHKGSLAKNPCKWLSFLMFYLCIHWMVAPRFDIQVLGENVAGFWIFRALTDAFLFYFMMLGVAGLDWSKGQLNKIYKIFTYISLVCSSYIFIQLIGFDQFQWVYNISHIRLQTNPHLTSFLGQTNFCASFLALLLPFVIHQKKWWIMIVTCTAIVLTESLMGIGMAGCVFIIYLLRYRMAKIIILTFLISGLYLGVMFQDMLIPKLITASHGRTISITEAITQTIDSPLSKNTFAMTGYGLGSYEFIQRHLGTTGFAEVHNEYVEFFSTTGLIGFALLIFSIFWLFKNIFPIIIIDRDIFAAACSFLVICIGNLGLFMWQIEPHRFYTVFLLGIIFNRLKRS